MRPESVTFECLDCGHRIDDPPEGRRCPECDGELQNISVPRDI
jgi:Zn finger protein HypA/HybF involved in hydrogenase expression